MAVPAFNVALEHPLCYPNQLENQRKLFLPTPAASKDNFETSSALVVQKSTEDKILFMYERSRIADLLCTYAYTLDSTMMDRKVAQDWANLFTEDCVVSYPFGTHVGRIGLPEFGMYAESRFRRMHHISTNYAIVFESDDVAHARYTCFAIHGTHKTDISKHFMEGGYYYSSFRREKMNNCDVWKFSHLTLDMVWNSGDSMGLNEMHEPAKVKEFRL